MGYRVLPIAIVVLFIAWAMIITAVVWRLDHLN